MPRVVKEEQHAAKIDRILTAAERLIYTKGYERMTIQDLLDELQISKGAFFHYFESKAAVLEAIIRRMQEAAEQPLRAIVDDPDLPAIDKLNRFFTSLDQSRTRYEAFIAELLRVWLSDDNAIVREKVHQAMTERRAPMLNRIVGQGIQEGTFATPNPDQAGEVIMTLARGMGDTLAGLMLACAQGGDRQHYADRIAATYEAYVSAVERLLAAPPGSIDRPDSAAIMALLGSIK